MGAGGEFCPGKLAIADFFRRAPGLKAITFHSISLESRARFARVIFLPSA
jgi:hypothetical protein